MSHDNTATSICKNWKITQVPFSLSLNQHWRLSLLDNLFLVWIFPPFALFWFSFFSGFSFSFSEKKKKSKKSADEKLILCDGVTCDSCDFVRLCDSVCNLECWYGANALGCVRSKVDYMELDYLCQCFLQIKDIFGLRHAGSSHVVDVKNFHLTEVGPQVDRIGIVEWV